MTVKARVRQWSFRCNRPARCRTAHCIHAACARAMERAMRKPYSRFRALHGELDIKE